MPLWYGAKTLGPCGFASQPVARKKEVSVQQGDNMDDIVSTQNAPLGRKDTTKRKGNQAGNEEPDITETHQAQASLAPGEKMTNSPRICKHLRTLLYTTANTV